MARKNIEQNHFINNTSNETSIEDIITQQNLMLNGNISFEDDNISESKEKDISENKKDIISESKEKDISENKKDIISENKENNINKSDNFCKKLKLIKAATYYSQGIVFRQNQIVPIKNKTIFDKLIASQLFMEV